MGDGIRVIASAHLAAGIVAGMMAGRLAHGRTSRVAVALGLGVLSHVALDAIPHSDYGALSPSTIAWIVLGESVVVGLVAAGILRGRVMPGWRWSLPAGVFGSVIPDAKFMARLLLPDAMAQQVREYGNHFHSYFHAAPMSHLVWGLGTEIACTLMLLASLTAFARVKPPAADQSGPRPTSA